MISVTVRGNNRVANHLRTVATSAPKAFDNVMYRQMQGWRSDLKAEPYPPRRPNQTYIRTGRLANSWGVQKQSAGKYRIVNTAPYAGYVVGARSQAWMHKERWWTVEEILSERQRRRDLTEALTKALKEELDGD